MEKFDLFFFEEHYDNGLCRIDNGVETLKLFESDDAYVMISEPKKTTEMVCALKTYYSDTLTLKMEGKYLKNGDTEIGVWKTYDRFGGIIEETDYEEGWNTHWEDLLQLMQEQKIDLQAILNISRYINERQKNEAYEELLNTEDAEDWIGFNITQDEETENNENIFGKLWVVAVASEAGVYYTKYVFDSDQRKKVSEQIHMIN